MPEEYAAQSPQDIRLITFKKWNLPHTVSICEIMAEYGEYVSYQDYHFIDIQSVQPSEKTANGEHFSSVYEQLKANRVVQTEITPPMDVHAIQSMTLVGQSTDFWNERPPILYISLIQLTNQHIDDIPILEEEILKTVRASGPSSAPPRCALYESLDFCDLVLFTAGIELDALQRNLWSLTLNRNKQGFQIIRDTFSFCCFHRQFLQQVFQGETANWEDKLSLSVDLSIQCLERWNVLRKELEGIHTCEISRTLGRHDVRLTYYGITGHMVLQILSKLDALCHAEEEEFDMAFGSYHVTLFSKFLEDIAPSTRSNVDTALYQATRHAMEQWHTNQVSGAYDVSRAYIEETFSALLTLSKSGFADEFVVSVLPSLLSYIDLLNELFEQENEQDCEWNQEAFKEKVMSMPQIYFRALNTLALCTMHNERQFIQSPAFHATYFDIPPKLLAFYNALADDIVQTISSQEEKAYHFLLIPDYRDDIVVTQLEINTKSDPKEHLAVVSLHESLFYEPNKAIAVLCHEIFHYVGNRQREQRAEYIFQAVGIHLLKNTTPFVHERQGWKFCGSLLELLSQGFSNCMKALHDVNRCGTTYRKIPYILQGVSDFLNQTDYGYSLFFDSNYSAMLEETWRAQLTEKLTNHPNTQMQSDFTNAMERIDYTLHSEMFVDWPSTLEYAVDVFIQSLLSELLHIKDEWKLAEVFIGASIMDDYVNSCQNIIQAFSETYADFKMLTLLEGKISREMYWTFLGVDDNPENTQLLLRYSAVCRSGVFTNENGSDSPEFGEGGDVYEIVVELLTRYLRGLPNDIRDIERMKELRDIYQTFLDGDALTQVDWIRNKISGYRQVLIDQILDGV